MTTAIIDLGVVVVVDDGEDLFLDENADGLDGDNFGVRFFVVAWLCLAVVRACR